MFVSFWFTFEYASNIDYLKYTKSLSYSFPIGNRQLDMLKCNKRTRESAKHSIGCSKQQILLCAATTSRDHRPIVDVSNSARSAHIQITQPREAAIENQPRHRNCADQREYRSLTIRARSPFSSTASSLSTRSICTNKSEGSEKNTKAAQGAQIQASKNGNAKRRSRHRRQGGYRDEFEREWPD